MGRFRIECEYETGDGTVPELRATWGRFEVHVEAAGVSRCVTIFEDMVDRELRRGIPRPLYPVAEWILANWWAITREPAHEGRRGYWKRHNLRAAEEGFALPDLDFASHGDRVLLKWTPHEAPHQQARFVESGTAWVPRDEFAAELLRFVEGVVHRLQKHHMADTFVAREFEALQRLSGEEHEFCRAAGALGLDPYHVDESLAATIEESTSRLPSEIHDETFAAAQPESLAEFVGEVAAALQDSEGHVFDVARLAGLVRPRSVAERSRAPYLSGYARAAELRSALGLAVPHLGNGGAAVRFEPIDLRLDDLARRGTWTQRATRVDAVGDARVARELRLSTPMFHANSRRFAIARAIGEYLALPAPGPFLVVAGSASSHAAATSRQQYNRAFAAEWLAPAESLRRARDEAGGWDEDLVIEWAADLEVSEQVVRWQLRNQVERIP